MHFKAKGHQIMQFHYFIWHFKLVTFRAYCHRVWGNLHKICLPGKVKYHLPQ